MTSTNARIVHLLLLAVSSSGIFTAAFLAPPTTIATIPTAAATSSTTSIFASNPKINQPSINDYDAATSLSLLLATLLVLAPLPSYADGQTKEFKLPPIDYTDKSRCVLNSSKMGQANAARDRLYDLRECKLSGVSGAEYDLSGVIMSKTDVSKANFREAQFSKGYLRDSNFDGADFTNAIVDRATFKGSSLRGAIFSNAVLTATSFEGADVGEWDTTSNCTHEYGTRNQTFTMQYMIRFFQSLPLLHV